MLLGRRFVIVAIATLSLLALSQAQIFDEECEITIETYGRDDAHYLAGYIKVFGEYVLEWSSQFIGDGEGWFLVELGAACDVVSKASLSSSNTSADLAAYISAVHRGHHLIVATANGTEVLANDITSDHDTSRLLNSLGVDASFYVDDSRVDSIMFVAQKGFPERLKFEVVPGRAFTRQFEVSFPVDVAACTPPLPSLWQVPQVSRPLDRSLLIPEHGFDCDGVVKAWEFVVDSLHEVDFTFAIFDYNASDSYSVVAEFPVVSVGHGGGQPQFKCINTTAQTEVKTGYRYGILHDAISAGDFGVRFIDNSMLPDRKWPHACGWGVTQEFLEPMVRCPYSTSDLPGSQFQCANAGYIALAAFRPIMDQDFVYTCACESDSDCTAGGDSNMHCDQEKEICLCHGVYTFDSLYHKCVVGFNLAAEKPTYQSSTYVWSDTMSYGPGLATDTQSNETQSNDFLQRSCTLTADDSTPWWVVDLGAEVELGTVSLTTASHIVEALFTWNSASRSFHMFTATGDVPAEFGQVDSIVIFGRSCWRLFTPNDGQSTVICGTGVKTTLESSEFGLVGNLTQAIHKLDVYRLVHKSTSDCLDTDSVTQQAVLGSDCTTSWFIDDNQAYTLEEEVYGLHTDSKILTKGYSTGLDFNPQGHIITTEITGCLVIGTGGVRNLVHSSSTGSCAAFERQPLNTVPDVLKPAVISNLTEYFNSDATDHTSYHSLLVDFENQHRPPCIESYSGDNSSQVTLDVSVGQLTEVDLQLAVDGVPSWPESVYLAYTYFLSLPKLHDFTILVGDSFDPSYRGPFPMPGFTECLSFHGNFKDGDTQMLTCTRKAVGRYMVIFQTADGSVYDIGPGINEQISLCNVVVNGIPDSDVLHYCQTSDDCPAVYMECDTRTMACSCRAGFQYNEGAQACFDVDECEIGTHTCDLTSTCLNELGSYKCLCGLGYILVLLNEQGDTECRDDNECWTSNGGCSHGCVNVPGTYICRCDDGYIISGNGHTCVDVNECDTVDCGNGTCINTVGSHHCQCWDGYSSTNDSMSNPCENINECEEGIHGCEHICGDFDGGYNCTCFKGFHLSDNDISCLDVNECLDQCQDNAYCLNLPGDFICECEDGFKNNPSDYGSCIHDEDWCQEENGDCEQICIWNNQTQTPACDCWEGFQLSLDEYSCLDLDECSAPEHPCGPHADCINTVGSYFCRCHHGYAQQDQTENCTHIGACAMAKGGCDHICEDSDGSVNCSCREGFVLGLDGFSCLDEDFCKNDTYCEHICIYDPPDESRCICREGYELNIDERTCDMVDACLDENGGCMHQCHNDQPLYHCTCEVGWDLSADLHSCFDTNECATANGGCASSCENVIGSYRCSCDSGYYLHADGRNCPDVDECSTDTGGCEHQCENLVGTYKCSCNDGFSLSGDGHSCPDIDECTTTTPCQQTCINTPGSFLCQCSADYFLAANGLDCYETDECATENGGCTHNCKNLVGSYICSCDPGYYLQSDKHTCKDVDECSADNGGCEHQCENLAGTYKCSCNDGFSLSDNKRSCQDIDECTSKPCQQTCINTLGGFLCQCSYRFKVAPNGLDCKGPHVLEYTWTLTNVPWNPQFGNMASDEAQAMRTALLDLLKNGALKIVGLVKYDVGNFRERSFREGSFSFDLIGEFEDSVSDEQQVAIGMELTKATEGKTLAVAGQTYKLKDGPTLVYVAGDGVETEVPMESICRLYEEIGACQNGGECEEKDGKPVCSCPEDYAGAHCEITPEQAAAAAAADAADDDDLSTAEIWLLALFGLVFVVLLGVVIYLVLARDVLLNRQVIRAVAQQRVDEENAAASAKFQSPSLYPMYAQSYWRKPPVSY